MTDDHVANDSLQDYLDGLLSGDERLAVEAHLGRCPTCSAETARMRAIIGELHALPMEVDPGVDLRPAIRREMRRRSAARERTLALHDLRWVLASAAAVLVVVTAAITVLLVRDPATGTHNGAANFATLEREYVRAADDLARALEGERERLSPEALHMVEESLRLVERALAESRAALSEDPVSPVLRELVLAAHRHRLDVLRRATVLTAGT